MLDHSDTALLLLRRTWSRLRLMNMPPSMQAAARRFHTIEHTPVIRTIYSMFVLVELETIYVPVPCTLYPVASFQVTGCKRRTLLTRDRREYICMLFVVACLVLQRCNVVSNIFSVGQKRPNILILHTSILDTPYGIHVLLTITVYHVYLRSCLPHHHRDLSSRPRHGQPRNLLPFLLPAPQPI